MAPKKRETPVLSSFFSSDGSSTIQFAIIFIVIFAVLAAVVFAFRRLTGRGHALSTKLGARGRQPRLGIVDIYELDRQRQLILLRRDNVEHLLLVGGPNDVVIERNISRGVGARLGTDEAARREPELESESEPAASLEPPRFQPAFEPAFEMPVVVAPPLPGSTTRPASVGRPLDLSAPDTADIFVPEPPRAPEPTRSPEPSFAAETARIREPATEPAPRTDPPASRPARRLPPSLANLVPGAAKRAQAAEDASRPDPEPIPEVRPEAPVPQRSFDAAILSDMARQLEQAVRRPSPAAAPPRLPEPNREPVPAPPAPTFVVAPEPAPIPAPAPVMMAEPRAQPEAVFTPVAAVAEPAAAPTFAEPRPAEPEAVDPIAAAMAATAEAPELDAGQADDLFEAPQPAAPVTEPDRSGLDRSGLDLDPSALPPDGPVAPPLAPEAPPPAPEPVKPDPVKPAPTKAAPAPNPFSVEEIEAEFARLLGRPLDKKS